MKILTPDEEKAHYEAVLKKGTQWGLTGLTGGLVGASFLNRYWLGFRGLTLPLKAFAVTSVATFSLIIGADRASRDFEEKALEAAGIGWQDEELERRLGLNDQEGSMNLKHYRSLDTRGRLLEHFKENKFQYVFGSWVAFMAGSFGFIATQPMPFTQKLVQARMYAQGLTVAVVLASAALASVSTGDNGDLSSREAQERRESSMYKFKSGSPHQVEAARLREQHQRE